MKLSAIVSAVLLFSAPLPALAGGAMFCLDFADGACVSPLVNGGQIKLGQLSGQNGNAQVLHFFSTHSATAGEIYFHHWEMSPSARGKTAGEHRWSGVAPQESAKAALAASALGAGPAKASFGFTAKASGANYRLHSWRMIHGAGKVAAILAGPDGQPQGEAITLEIVE